MMSMLSTFFFVILWYLVIFFLLLYHKWHVIRTCEHIGCFIFVFFWPLTVGLLFYFYFCFLYFLLIFCFFCFHVWFDFVFFIFFVWCFFSLSNLTRLWTVEKTIFYAKYRLFFYFWDFDLFWYWCELNYIQWKYVQSESTIFF